MLHLLRVYPSTSEIVPPYPSLESVITRLKSASAAKLRRICIKLSNNSVPYPRQYGLCTCQSTRLCICVGKALRLFPVRETFQLVHCVWGWYAKS